MSKIAGITLGDPAGVGPEVVIKSLEYFLKKEKDFTFLLFGDKYVVEKNQKQIEADFKINYINIPITSPMRF